MSHPGIRLQINPPNLGPVLGIGRDHGCYSASRIAMATFTCAHCGTEVAPLGGNTRNACTKCHWSKHVAFGTDVRPPCGALMQATLVGDDEVVWRCTGCGFMIRGPAEARMDVMLTRGAVFNPAADCTFFTDGEELVML